MAFERRINLSRDYIEKVIKKKNKKYFSYLYHMAIEKWDKETQEMIDIVEGTKKRKKRRYLKSFIGKVLCFLSIHKWSKEKFETSSSSNVRNYSKICLRCKKVVTRIESRTFHKNI